MTWPCGIRHIRLDDPAAPIVPADGERSLLVVVWREGMPVARRFLSEGELPLSAEAARVLAADAAADVVLDRAGGLAARDGHPAPRHADPAWVAAEVSVIVCTRNRPEELAGCLAALARLDPAPLEIIVVDNGSDGDSTRQVVSNAPDVRLVEEPAPGLSRARNAGLRAARGSVMAFTDDDALPEPDWLSALTGCMQADPRIGCTTGTVLPATLDTIGAWIFEVDYGGFGSDLRPTRFGKSLLRQKFSEAIPVWKIGAGANMALRRNLVDEIGGFDVRLGAGATGCSEDSEFWRRAIEAGWDIAHEPASVVHHMHRADLPALRRQLRAYTRGHICALFAEFARHRHFGDIFRALVSLPVYCVLATAYRAVQSRSTRRLTSLSELVGALEAPFWWLVWAGRDPGLRLAPTPEISSLEQKEQIS